MKPTIGLTGGICSGKSTVAAMFRDLGITVVDADVLAREAVAPGSDGLREIVDAFGQEFLQPDGALDRKKVADWIFAHPDDRKKLNHIVHPKVRALSIQRLHDAGNNSTAPYVIYDAALLVEEGIYKQLAALIVVAASEETQIARCMQRDGITRSETEARLRAQLPLAEKVKVADHVIDNNGTLEATRARVEAVHRAIITHIS